LLVAESEQLKQDDDHGDRSRHYQQEPLSSDKGTNSLKERFHIKN